MEKISGLNWALAKVVKEMREARGWTQAQLAGFAGLSEAYISKLEQGVRGDSINGLFLISQAFSSPPSVIVRAIEDVMKNGSEKTLRRKGRPRKSSI